ncbi:Rieske 2Fe-2S domain-containing protein [Propioniciclava coleopterorum]|uniref:Cytochrome bc1 complex Rieske iron-sulfur subunit n=1 Tax=Propioniciclava coleopterorum TaxID=2714937 RepID=A0A6G7Y8B1_9ACTN|nr:Rieske 2Fe-2S domain-containing protein [Propioniciclava coleopterorum]QIK72916.1 Rieske 2Fe-2S domain-containing protein [Propioniciclava coleopterorum]
MTHDQSTLARREPGDPHFPVADPGIEEHVERYTDSDPALGRRAYLQVVTAFALVPVFAIAFVVVYFAVPRDASAHLLGVNWNVQTTLLGLTAGLAVLLIGIGAIHWARQLMTDTEIAEERHPVHSTDAEKEGFVEVLNAGVADAGVKRRGLILASFGGALGIMAVPALVTLADLGPWPTADLRKKTLEYTLWAEGVRVVNDTNWVPLKAADIEIGQLINAEPENLRDLHGVEYQNMKAKTALIVVRMDPNSIKIPESRKDWQVGGILAYSKICTHVGCPISLWEQQTHHLLCPCHQSTFDLGDSGVVVFGPAARALPQLPLKVDGQGYLIAQSDFTVPVGPSFFERDSRNDFKEGDR